MSAPTRAEIVDIVADVLDRDRAMCRPHHRVLGGRVAAELAERGLVMGDDPARASTLPPPPREATPTVEVRAQKPAESSATRKPPTHAAPLLLDVSHWQGAIDWQAVAGDAQALAGVIIRTGDGKAPDRRAITNMQGAHAAGLPIDCYHYLRGAHSAQLQLDVAARLIDAAGVPVRMLHPDVEGHRDPDGDGPRRASGIFQDLRPDVDENIERALLVARQFAEGAQRLTGHAPWLYVGQTWRGELWPARGLSDAAEADRAYLASMPLWLAVGSRRYVPQPWDAPHAVQYTARGEVRGISGPVDLSRLYG